MTTQSSSWLSPEMRVALGCGIISTVTAAPVIATTASIFILPVSQEFHWPRYEFPLAIMAAAWVGAAAAPVAGRLIDRYGARTIFLIGITAFAAANILLAFSSGQRFIAYPLYMLLGASSSFSGTIGLNKVISAWFHDTRGRALGWSLGAGIGVGAFVSPLLTQYCIHSFGWRAAYLALGTLVFAVAFPAALFFIPNTLPKIVSAVSAGGAGLTTKEAMRTREFWLLLGITVFNGFAAGGIGGHWLPIQTAHGATVGLATVLLASLGLIKIASQVGAGALLDRFQTQRLAVPLLLPILISLIFFALAKTAGSAALAGILFGLGEGADVCLLPYLASRYFGMKNLGEISGYIAASAIISGGLGNVGMGAFFERTGSYDFGLVVACGIFSLALLVALGLRSYRFGQGAHSLDETGTALSQEVG
ncbi:MAG: MFS transporter [Alphaproteobacteria bacterium]|nr:MFS transporter [Alphaproteobacteria bacterium]MBL7097290.1 MFS transporter [Alphaproteobacteria bacterium]